MAILDNVNGCADVKKLNTASLEVLAKEVRSQILSVTEKNGGHLSSNLGIVETTIALYHVFDFPKDKLIFDVGHQCYTHKLLSGRKDRFDTIRSTNGLSGFPDREESEYDAVSTGHAGNSIASALGICAARDSLKQDYQVIAVVGDGSLVNGLNSEAINASNVKPSNLVVIVNDNGMSISRNKNGFYKLISKSTTKGGYLKGKRVIKKVFGNSFVTGFLRKVREAIKRLFNRNNYFERLGFKYVGVIDGNDIHELLSILPRVKTLAKDKAVLLHVRTTKGKGFDKAEENAEGYHGVSRGEASSVCGFGKRLGETLNSIMKEDNSVVAITAGMKEGTGLCLVEKENPDKFIDVGIAEEYAVSLASGMAIGGLKPVVAIYSTFLQRAYDQIVHDVCAQNLPVVFCLDRAGFVGEDGKTHQGLFDISFLSHIPNLTVLTPTDENDLEICLRHAISLNCPVAIRYPKQSDIQLDINVEGVKWATLVEGEETTLLAVGPRAIKVACETAKICAKPLRVVAVRSVIPLDSTLLDGLKGNVITIEENLLAGGFGQAVCAYYSDNKNNQVKVYRVGVDGVFVKHGDVQTQLKSFGLDGRSLAELVQSL